MRDAWVGRQCRRLAACALLLALAAPARAADTTYVAHQALALRAYNVHDYAGMHWHLSQVQAQIGFSANVAYNLACTEALLGDRAAALGHLREFAATGLMADFGADDDLASLRGEREFQTLATRVHGNGAAIGKRTLVHAFRDADWLPEDLAYDAAAKCWYVSCVHRGCVLRLDGTGAQTRLEGIVPPGWSAFGIACDVLRRRLWVCIAATPTAEGYAAADSNRTSLVCWDLARNRRLHRFDLPQSAQRRLLGDLCVTHDGTVYVSDAQAGAIYRVRTKADSMLVLVPEGGLRGPQTPVLAADGARLYVPDVTGIAIVTLATSAVTRLRGASGVALNGCDGLYADGGDLIGVQNGTQPARITRFTLDASGTQALRARVLEQGTEAFGEPTHGALLGREFHFLANTGWERVGADQRYKPAATARPAELRRITIGGK